MFKWFCIFDKLIYNSQQSDVNYNLISINEVLIINNPIIWTVSPLKDSDE